MRDQNLPAFYVLSPERPELSDDENAGRVAFMATQLINAGADVTPVKGRYCGHDEISFIVWDRKVQFADAIALRAMVLRLARTYKQQALLHVDTERRACLINADGDLIRKLGEWREIPASEARALSAFTQTPDGRFWRAGT